MSISRNRAVVPASFATSADVYDVAAPASESPGLSLAQVLAMLRAQRKVAVMIAIGVVLLAALAIKLLPKSYTASATMIVSYQVSQGGTEIPSWLIGTYMATQVELMKSSEVVLPVVESLGLDRDPEFTAGFRGGDQMALRNYAKENLDKQLAVEQGRGSQLLYVTATSNNPVKAAAIANAVADMYSKREKQRLKDPADDRARNYSEQLEELRAKVTAAQQKVTELRQKTGTSPIATNDTGGNNAPDVEQQNLMSLEQQLLTVQSLRRAAETATNIGAVGTNGTAEGSPQIRALHAEISAKELQLSQLSSTYGAKHPKVLELQSNLDQARAQLKAEERDYLADTHQMEAKLRAALDAQRQKVMEQRKAQDAGAKLQLELESTQSVYKRALDGYDQIMFATAGSPTNVSFVSRAPVPTEPTKPNKVKLMLVGLVMALLIGISAPIAYELLFDRRLHCNDDL